MEQKIRFTTVTHFDLSHEEINRLYTTLALFQYKYKQTPNYNEITLHKRLCNDFNRFNLEIIKTLESDPNNHTLNQIRNFFQCYYGVIKKIVKQEAKDEYSSIIDVI